MKLLLFLCSCLFVVTTGHYGGKVKEESLLYRTLDALDRALDHMKEELEYLILDSIMNIRQVEAQLDAYLTHEPEVFLFTRRWVEQLKEKAKRVADDGVAVIAKNFPEYSAELGFLLVEPKKRIWYESSDTSKEFVEEPVPCSGYSWNGTASDLCFSEMMGKGGPKDNPCNLSSSCMSIMTARNQRDYALTHQLLNFIFMEEFKCIEEVPQELRLRFCSNVLRDANLIAEGDYPLSHRDLFVEQIGLCGFHGFREFNNPEWLEAILDWQQESGCYTNFAYYNCDDNMSSPHKKRSRTKRNEKTLPDGCLAHKTTVAMLALVVNIRFEAEKEFSKMETIILNNIFN